MYFSKDKTRVLEEFNVSKDKGLSLEQAKQGLEKYGENKFAKARQKSRLVMFFEQFGEVMVFILIAAALVSFFLKEPLEAAIILLIVLLNATLGFIQEAKAQKALDALEKMSVPYARVRRNGQIEVIDSTLLVPGDIVLLEAGNIVPADGRILESAALKIEESALTGESEPVEKNANIIEDPKTALADRKNMAFKNSLVTYGRGEMIVSATGMKTEIGKIAGMLQNVKKGKSPLEKRLDRLGKFLALAAIGLIILVALIVYATGNYEDWKELLKTAISMAVAAIPEGLAAVVTISLALGAGRLLKKNSLMRNLPSVETLGSVTVICSDKTGTLTQNKMSVRRVLTMKPGERDLEFDADPGKCAKALLLAGSMANDGRVSDVNGEFSLIGDPTETAIIQAALDSGMDIKSLHDGWPRTGEAPFDSERKRMSTSFDYSEAPEMVSEVFDFLPKNNELVFCKGSADGLLEICSSYFNGEKVLPLDDDTKAEILKRNNNNASGGLRTLGMAVKSTERGRKLEVDLVFLGIAAMEDPVRPEAVEAVHTCLKAGIRPIMITGDHPVTALAIAKQLGLSENEETLIGSDLDEMDDARLAEAASRTSIFARVSPEHKMRLVDALQGMNNIVSMTGDGVNDAPALKSADIGVAMGITGTDVSKQSADMVLLDDNFATIVSAVKEGRVIYDNIKKFIKYILTGNVGEILVMLIAPFLGFPLPLLPLQILWINLVTDGAPGIAMGYEKAERNTMRRPPYRPNESVFSRGTGRQILIYGVLVAVLSLVSGFFGRRIFEANDSWQTMIFTTLTFCQMQLAFSVRSSRDSIFRYGLFSNLPMFFTVLTTVILQFALIYLPFMQSIFSTKPLSWAEVLICVGSSFLILIFAEIEKTFLRKKQA